MAKYHGIIGFCKSVENPEGSGIYEDKVVERNYYGDVQNTAHKWKDRNEINNTSLIEAEFSILADAYAYLNFTNMKYIEYLGEFWSIVNATPERPRINIKIGGVWNGQRADTEGT